jgi:hypothetical protein
MSASNAAKQLGAKSIKDVAEYYGKHRDTIQNWHKDNPRLFEAAVSYYVNQLSEG